MSEITVLSRSRSGLFLESMFGAVADINVWSKTLSEGEVEEFTECRGSSGDFSGSSFLNNKEDIHFLP